MNQQKARFAVALTLLVGATWFLQARQNHEHVPPHSELSSFPRELGGWSGVEVPIPEETRKFLRAGDLLLRRYSEEKSEAPADLYIAYFPTQQTGATYHSPSNCAPANGWFPVQKSVVVVEGKGFESFPANQFVVEKGGSHQLVLYWYLSHGHAVASEYRAKIRLVTDSFKLNRSDGALIRINTPMLSGETVDEAMGRLLPFTDLVVPQLDGYIPR